MYILRCLFFSLSLSFSLSLLLSLRKHWHSSCWFLTFVDRDLILSNILDLLFLQRFSCASAAALRWPCMHGQGTEDCGYGAGTLLLALPLHKHRRQLFWPPSTDTHLHTQPKSSGPRLLSNNSLLSPPLPPSVTPLLLTTQSQAFWLPTLTLPTSFLRS